MNILNLAGFLNIVDDSNSSMKQCYYEMLTWCFGTNVPKHVTFSFQNIKFSDLKLLFHIHNKSKCKHHKND